MSGAVVGTIGSVVGAVGSAVSVGNALFGGGGGGQQVQAPAQQSGGSGTGTAPFQGLSAFAQAGVEPRATPQAGRSEEAPVASSNGMMKMDDSTPRPEKAATKYSINSTPSTDPGEGYAQKDENDIWASRLSRYLDYNTRRLG